MLTFHPEKQWLTVLQAPRPRFLARGFAVLQWLFGVGAGVGMVAWLVMQSGPSTGMALVHVIELDVTITIGRETIHVTERTEEPLFFELSAGINEFVVARRGQVLLREPFTIHRGGSVILTAYDPARTRSAQSRAPMRPDPASFPSGLRTPPPSIRAHQGSEPQRQQRMPDPPERLGADQANLAH